MRIRHLLLFVISIFVADVILSMSIILLPSNHDAQAVMYGIKHVTKTDYNDNELDSDTNALVKIKAATTIHETRSVSIVQDAAYVGNKAYWPNPINVKVGDTITWINNDVETHTVTSGLGFSTTDFGKKFDSGILGYKQTFSHKFSIAGELEYFCQFHPTMVGKVIVR